MKPPIVEAFEKKIKSDAIREYAKREKKIVPIDEIVVLVMCIVAIICVGVWAIPIVLINLAFLSYTRTIMINSVKRSEPETKVEDVEE